MDKASDFGSEDCEVESCRGQIAVILEKNDLRRTDSLNCFRYLQDYDFNVLKNVAKNVRNVISLCQLKYNTQKFSYI